MWSKLFLLFFVFVILLRTDQSFNQDLGRHIKLGEIIWQTKSVPKVNLFSYTNPDFPFINTHWLFEVVAYFFSQNLGLHIFLILKIIIFLCSIWLILKIIPKQNLALLLPIGLIFFHVLRERLELRPEIFSFLFTASTYFILEKYLKEKTKWIYGLPFIQLFWINTHIYFFVGLVLQAIFLIHTKFKQRILIIIFVLSISVSLINPNGITGLLYPLNVTKNYGYTIVENQTMFLLESIGFQNPNFLYVKISWAIIALSLVFIFIRKKFEIKNILIPVFGLALSILNVRSFPYLVFLSLPTTLQNFGIVRINNFTKFISLLTIAILIFESFSYLSGEYYKSRGSSNQVLIGMEQNVEGAMEFVVNNNLENPIFNNFDIGSYIFYKGYPKYKVFVDGRPEAYPKDFFQDIYIPMQSDYSKFKQKEKEYNFKTIIFSHTDQTPWGRNFLQNLVTDPNWKLVYIDDFMLVFILNDGSFNNLEEVKLSELSPKSFSYKSHVSYLRIGYFLISTKNTESGEKFLEKALQIYPKSPSLQSLF